VAGLFDHLGVARSHWVGMSLGGMIGQTLALQHPQRLDRLVLADTTARGAPNARTMWTQRAQTARTEGLGVLVDGTLARWFTAPYRAAHPQAMAGVAEMIRATSVEGYAGCCHAIADLDTLDHLHEIRRPTLVLVGDQDEATSPQMARDIQARIPGAELKVLADAAHISSIEQAEHFNECVLDFLQRGAAAP
jgi:3-oxoadipate enol-lactonase